MSDWPDYPPGCPPADAEDAEGVVYRLVGAKGLHDDEFRSHYERDREKWDGNCQARGLSVYRDAEDLAEGQQQVRGMAKKRIVVAMLPAGSGRIKDTPSSVWKSHRTWWVATGLSPAPLFRFYEAP